MPELVDTHIGTARCAPCGGVLQPGRACGSCAVLQTAKAASRLAFTVREQSDRPDVVELQLTPEFTARFELRRVLGRGTSGMVLLAIDRARDQEVAIKVLMRLENEDRARFLTEGRLLAKLASPHIVPIHELGELGEHPYLVTGYLPGGTLRERLAGGPLHVGEAVRVALDVLAGLEACHRAGVVHRDMKPENILFDKDGTARLVDLGIARHYGEARRNTQAGALLGTPFYMAPEQVRGEDAGTAADVHAVGLILFEMMAGRPAIEGTSLVDVLEAKARPVRDVRAAVTGLPDAIAAVVNGATALRIADRPATAAEMATRLERAIAALPASAASVPSTSRCVGAAAVARTPRGGRSRFMISGLSMTMCALMGAVTWSAYRAYHAPTKLIETQVVPDATRVSFRWTTDRACRSGILMWPQGDQQPSLTTWSASPAGLSHAVDIANLEDWRTHSYCYVYVRHGTESQSPIFRFQTRPMIRIFNIHVDEYTTKALVTWETNMRTDTTMCYGATGAPEDMLTNREQESETIHSITIDTLTPNTAYHYRITASDPQKYARVTASDSLQFRTARTDRPVDTGNAGLRNLLKSYVDRLARLTPDEREKLKTSIAKFAEHPTPLTPGALKPMLETRTTTDPDQYYNRLGALRDYVGSRPDARQALYHLERELHVNPVRAAWRMDRAIRDLAAGRALTPASVRAAPGPEVNAHAPPSSLPLVPVDSADADFAFRTGEELYKEGRIAIEQGRPDFAVKLSESVRHCARAVRADYKKARALYYVGSSLLYRAAAPEDLDRACELLEKSLALDRDARTLMDLGEAQALAGRTDRAIELLEQSCAMEPRNAHVHFLLSGLLDKQFADANTGKRAAEHVRSAIREKSEYKKKYQRAIKLSEMANRTAKLVLEILEKSENDQLTDAETEAYADRIAEDRVLVIAFGELFKGIGETFQAAMDGAVMVGKGFLGPIGEVGAGLWSVFRLADHTTSTKGTDEDDED